MKNVLFLLASVVISFASMFVLWEVYGFLVVGLWALSAAVQGSLYVVNPAHRAFDKLKAAGLGLNGGLTVAFVAALWALMGPWTLALALGAVGLAVYLHFVGSDEHHDPSYGATTRWA